MTETIRVLLADDHPAFRIGLRVLLEQAEDIQIVGETGDGKETLAQIETLRPDVVVLDCEMPGLKGTHVAAELKQRNLPTRVLALSAYCDENYVRGMVQAGAVGYLLKDEAPARIVEAVRAAAKGEGSFSAKIATQIAAWARGEQSYGLTARELAILRLLVEGKSNKEMAVVLGISDKTIEKHLSQVLEKMGASSRAEAAVRAVRKGLA